jgi:uncharacterized Tic20 family protein
LTFFFFFFQNAPITYFIFISFFFLDFLFKIKYMIGPFWKKKKKRVKVVELPQFESLGGGLSVTFETFEVKVKMGG